MGPSESDVRTMVKRRSRKKMDVDNSEEGPICRRRERLVHYYGTIKGEEVGKTYRNREKLKVIHHPDKSWIHLGPEGPYSLILQGKKRFLDEGSLIIIFTRAPVGSAESDRSSTCNSILGNLKKGLKGRLPIRVVRLVKSAADRKTVFRYDGLYIMKKKLILREKLHFLLTRIRNQPKVFFNLKRGSTKIRRLLALKKRTRRKQIKKEPVLKSEVTSNSDTERDSTTQVVEEISNWDQLKEEYAALGEEDPHDYDDDCYEVWQRGTFPSFVKADLDEQLDESTFIGYDDHVEKNETYYEELDDMVEDLNDEDDQEHFSKEDVIIETIPLLKTENDESSNSVRTILAFVSESGNSEYVEETSNVDFDPLCDPLGSFSDESKTSNCSDEIKNTSQEVKTCYDEKKSGELYLGGCENKDDDSEKDEFSPIMPHPCLYNLTIGHLINLLANRSHNNICPCNIQKCAAQKNFEVALKGLIDEGGKKSFNPKCLKGIEEDDMKQLESTEKNYFSSLSNVFYQLNAIICNRTTISDTQAPLIGKRQRITTTKILRKDKTSTKKYRSKKVVGPEESFVPVEDSLVSPSEEESLLPSMVEDSSQPPCADESLVPTEVSPCNGPAHGVSSPMPEDTALRLSSTNQEETEQELDPNDHPNKRRRGRQKGTRNYSREAAQLGPVIPTVEPVPIPRRLRDKKLSYRGATFYISPRNTSSRSAARRRVQEEEDTFVGFAGPIKPSKELRLVRSFLARLLSLEQSSSSQ